MATNNQEIEKIKDELEKRSKAVYDVERLTEIAKDYEQERLDNATTHKELEHRISILEMQSKAKQAIAERRKGQIEGLVISVFLLILSFVIGRIS